MLDGPSVGGRRSKLFRAIGRGKKRKKKNEKNEEKKKVGMRPGVVVNRSVMKQS